MTRAPEFYCKEHMQEFIKDFNSATEVIESTDEAHAKFRKACFVEGCEDPKTRRVRFAPAPEVQPDESAVVGDVPVLEAPSVVPSEPSEGSADAVAGLEPGTRQAARMARRLTESQASEDQAPQVVAPEGEGG